MNSWHYRLDAAIRARGATWDDLVRATGKKKPSVYAWKPEATKRSEMMDGENAARVCAFLRISPTWLFHNEGPSGLTEPLAKYVTGTAPIPLKVAEANPNEELLLSAYRRANPTARQLMLAQARAILDEAARKERPASA
jgi:hypothetical protein